jgi:hypothetical protein
MATTLTQMNSSRFPSLLVILKQLTTKTSLLMTALLGMGSLLYGQPNVYFEIRNESQVGATYTFEVWMRADQAGSYHNRGQVYIAYDTAAFGPSVVLNNKVTYTQRGLLGGTDALFGGPKYQTLPLNDNGNRLVVTWESNFANFCPPGASFHTEVPTSFDTLYRFTVSPMKNPARNPRLEFYTDFMLNQQFYSNPNPPNPRPVPFSCDLPYGNVGLLPVELSDFRVVPLNNGQVRLRWQTATERNNSHFEVQKKVDEGSFETLSWVLGQGNSQDFHNYQYLDATPMGTVNQYRLRQVDFDGNFTYSEVKEVVMDGAWEAFTVYPNPAREVLNIETMDVSGVYPYVIRNLQGQEIKRGSLSNGYLQVEISELAKGSYILEIGAKGQLSYRKPFHKL